MSEERLPYGKQISPRQIKLRKLLEIVRDAAPDPKVAHAAIGAEFFPKPGDTRNEVISGMNAFLAMRHHGLVTEGKTYALTTLADDLLATTTDQALTDAFATHLLLDLHGLQLVEVIKSLQARGESVTVPAVVGELQALGIESGGPTGENINPMRLWLEVAGVLKDRWTVDDAVLRRLTGATSADIAELAALPIQQQAILRALAASTDTPPTMGNKLRQDAELQSPSVTFDVKTFAKAVLAPLEADGWITTAKTTPGRGGKAGLITPTKRFQEVISEPLMAAVVEQAHPLDPVLLRRPIGDLLEVVDNPTKSTHERGLALEGVTIQVVRRLGLRFLGWRVRGDQTNGAEVDVIGDTVTGPYELVQLQSKAGPITGREYVDREVGVATRLKSNVIVFITAKKVGKAARKAAATYMRESNLSILFIDGADLKALNAGHSLARALDREWSVVRAIRSQRSAQRSEALED